MQYYVNLQLNSDISKKEKYISQVKNLPLFNTDAFPDLVKYLSCPVMCQIHCNYVRWREMNETDSEPIIGDIIHIMIVILCDKYSTFIRSGQLCGMKVKLDSESSSQQRGYMGCVLKNDWGSIGQKDDLKDNLGRRHRKHELERCSENLFLRRTGQCYFKLCAPHSICCNN